MKIPEPKFKVGDKVWHCGYIGQAFKVKVTGVYYEIDAIRPRTPHMRYIVRDHKKPEVQYDAAEIELRKKVKKL